ncbi:MAG: hypothetical protein H7Z40_13450 [Phycisphaerae bacterium]|nr:hypothetical protein [Gemmatimonadaceae bacterium]
MFSLKPVSAAAVPAALHKAEHYRLLNQPWAAESICLDILLAEPGHQEALRVLLLARTDQFGVHAARNTAQARETLNKLTSAYERAYYHGIICERRAKAEMEKRTLESGHAAYEWILQAMEHYAHAEQLKLSGDDDPILRWNSCVRLLQESPNVVPRETERMEPVLGE